MSSTAVNVTIPATNPTSVQLCQVAANIAGTLETNIQQGNYVDLYKAIGDLATAVNCLAQSGITVNNSTASSVGTLTVRNQYNLGANAVIPTTIATPQV